MNLKLPQELQAFLEVVKKYPFYTMTGLLLLLLLVDYFAILQFQLNTLTSLNPKIAQLSQKLETTRNDIQRIPQYQKEMENRRRQIAQINRKINSREEVPLVLENVSRIANRNKVKIERIMPDTSIVEPVLESNEGRYFFIPIVVEAKSGYHDFARFLDQLEKEGIFLDIPRLSIAANKNDTTNHVIRLTLDTIVFEENQNE